MPSNPPKPPRPPSQVVESNQSGSIVVHHAQHHQHRPHIRLLPWLCILETFCRPPTCHTPRRTPPTPLSRKTRRRPRATPRLAASRSPTQTELDPDPTPPATPDFRLLILTASPAALAPSLAEIITILLQHSPDAVTLCLSPHRSSPCETDTTQPRGIDETPLATASVARPRHSNTGLHPAATVALHSHIPNDAMEPTPRPSRSSSSASRKANLTLDLSNLPPLVQPTPPSNTLLFTNLTNPDVFRPDNLQSIRDLITKTAPIHAFAPLKSFRRIVVSFFDIDAAIAVRQVWDGEAVLGERLKVYYGQQTSVEAKDEHLALPDAGKLFFISPPPSPPHGWEMRLEDAPNKMVHADDLADALAKLHQRRDAVESPLSPVDGALLGGRGRSRSSTLIWHPEENGCSPDLPAVVVEDMTDKPEEISPLEASRPIMAHTARPPVELMHQA
ncbi:hypothetical protein Purlil1_11784 [Purpureocillium lilacinum]|uniref:Calcipressin n=1 Tax=Purpureocillium lilacinum TaxID=33203 RepID=A0ABR0BJV6_PURLI|nr:hypothetical protein Purlil1_11784 [Purpureocillium lilacinum]